MYLLKGSFTITWAPDGAQSMTVPSAQAMTLGDEGGINFAAPGPFLVPGLNSPSAANITTAINGLAAQIAGGMENATNLALIQGWATGGN